MLKLNIRAPEMLLGVLLTVALIALGMMYEASQNQPQSNQNQIATKATENIHPTSSADERIADYTLALVWLTGVLALATVGVGIFAWIGISNQSHETRVIERAYIAVDGAGILPFGPPTADSTARILIRNVGNLPARNLKWFINVTVDPDGSRSDFPIGDCNDFFGPVVLAKGTAMIGTQNFNTTEQQHTDFVNSRGTNIYVWGKIIYLDGFNTERYTLFCHRYSDGARVYSVAGELCAKVGDGMKG